MIDNEASNYRLTVGTYKGNAGNALNHNSLSVRHNGMPFSTLGRDNDHWKIGHCAIKYKAGWWFNRCRSANLNGLYFGTSIDGQGISWFTWRHWEQLKKSAMKIRHEPYHPI